ncbi:MAG: C-GCAxxG-C-C family protein [Vicinamibacterales bacterium]
MPWVASSERASKAAPAMASLESTKASAVSSPTIPLKLAGDLTTVPTSTLRRRSMSNLLRMGHCAPTVMQTLLDASDTEAEWLVKLTAGLPGGIGNTGAECGGVTGPLVLIGLRHARGPMHHGLPPFIDKGHDLLQRFEGFHGTTLCREIRGTDRLPLRCVGAVRRAPELCAQTLSSDCADVIPAASRDAYGRLYAHFVEKEFHCAHAVVQHVRHMNHVSQDVLDATAPFIGGTVLTGMTCSALTAGVMALGMALGEVERSCLRVLRMIGKMAAGGDAFADEVNKFNRTMNLGHQLAGWFTGAFGSTQCRAITRCDFSTTAGVNQYIDTDGVARCQAIAQQVAARVEGMVDSAV